MAGVVPWQALCLLVFLLGATATSAAPKYQDDVSDQELISILARFLRDETKKTDQADKKVDGAEQEIEGAEKKRADIEEKIGFENNIESVEKKIAKDDKKVEGVEEDEKSLSDYSDKELYSMLENILSDENEGTGNKIAKDEKKIAEDEKKIAKAEKKPRSDDSDEELVNVLAKILGEENHKTDQAETEAIQTAQNGRIRAFDGAAEKFPGCGDHPKVIAPSDAGSLQSPAYSYGTTYPANLFCSYLILGPPGKTITLSFPQFNVEEGLLFGLTCPFDWLKVYDGNGASDFQLLKACGNSAPDQITSSTDAIFIEFSTDSTKQKAGWVIDYAFNQVSPPAPGDPCDATAELLEGDNLDIFSPNFGLGDYPLNATCVWHVQAASGNQIRVHFVAMSIEVHPSCGWDYLLIGAGHKQAGDEDFQNKLCGEIGDPPREDIVLSGTEATFVFHSDDSIQYDGFHVLVTSETAGPTPPPTPSTTPGGGGGGGENTPPPTPAPTPASTPTPTPAPTPGGGGGGSSTTLPDDCGFEEDFCGWENEDGTQADFIRRKANDTHLYSSYLPAKDISEESVEGYYIMPETSDLSKGDKAVLISVSMPPTQGLGRCMRFAYWKEGASGGNVNIKIRPDNGDETVIWSRRGDHGLRWFAAMATIKSTQNHRLVVEVVVDGSGYDNYFILDALSFSDEACVPVTPECGQRGGSDTSKKILNGEQAATNEWPFIAHLSISDSDRLYQCGGSLIAPQWVLSAAHCVEFGGEITKDVTVYLGETSLLDNSENNFKVMAEDVFVHPMRTSVGVAPYDVALIKLPYPVHLTETTNTVCLPDVADWFEPGDRCTTIGWGGTETGQLSKELLHVDLILMSDAECSSVFSITSDMLCAKPLAEDILQDACGGDSGGPLTCEKNGKYYLAGIVSWGQHCSDIAIGNNKPGVFGEVTAFTSWINEIMADNTDTPIN